MASAPQSLRNRATVVCTTVTVRVLSPRHTMSSNTSGGHRGPTADQQCGEQIALPLPGDADVVVPQVHHQRAEHTHSHHDIESQDRRRTAPGEHRAG